MKTLYVLIIIPFLLFSQTPCLDEVANATGLIGEFIPQCEQDGSYSPLQCWSSTGYCWCVDNYGVEIPGTSLGPGEGIPDCESAQMNLCDSISVSLLSYNEAANSFEISISTDFNTEYWFGYCGLIITDNQGDTVAMENINNAANVYGLGPGMNELRLLELQQENPVLPIAGQIHLVDGFFAGNSYIACSWPFYLDSKNNSPIIEFSTKKQVTQTIDLLGRKRTANNLYIKLYDDGSVAKIMLIK